MTINVKSCKTLMKGLKQSISVCIAFEMQEVDSLKHVNLGKRKHLFPNLFKLYDPSRVAPLERGGGDSHQKSPSPGKCIIKAQ